MPMSSKEFLSYVVIEILVFKTKKLKNLFEIYCFHNFQPSIFSLHHNMEEINKLSNDV